MPVLALPRSDIMHVSEVTDDISFFAANGYLVLKSMFPEELIDELAAWTRRRFWSSDGKLLQSRLQDEWKTCARVRELAVHPLILEKLRILYEREPIPFQTLNFPVGTQQATHSDTVHFHCFPQRFMCGVWVAFESVTDDNGPLHYYPGSHRLPTLECSDFGVSGSSGDYKLRRFHSPGHYQRYEAAVAELIQIAGLRKQTVRFEKGDALIWAANLLHGGEPIRTPGASRLSQVTHYYFEGCRFYTPLLSDLRRGYVHFRDGIRNILTDQPVGRRGLLARLRSRLNHIRLGKRS